MSMKACILLLPLCLATAFADVYMHNPRGRLLFSLHSRSSVRLAISCGVDILVYFHRHFRERRDFSLVIAVLAAATGTARGTRTVFPSFEPSTISVPAYFGFGSNDRNCERNQNRKNGNRLFDSQNNAKVSL